MNLIRQSLFCQFYKSVFAVHSKCANSQRNGALRASITRLEKKIARWERQESLTNADRHALCLELSDIKHACIFSNRVKRTAQLKSPCSQLRLEDILWPCSYFQFTPFKIGMHAFSKWHITTLCQLTISWEHFSIWLISLLCLCYQAPWKHFKEILIHRKTRVNSLRYRYR